MMSTTKNAWSELYNTQTMRGFMADDNYNYRLVNVGDVTILSDNDS